jgi:histidinol-phosphate phosphatase family protein
MNGERTARSAAFLDRDGWFIYDREFLADPRDVQLLPGAADAVRRLNHADVPVVIVTNQSGIARGLITEDQYEAVRERLDSLLRVEGAWVDGTYMCPHHPDFTGPCDCRKPCDALFRKAAAEHSLDLACSLFAGDRWRDVAPGAEAGGLAVLIPGAGTPRADRVRAELDERVLTLRSLDDAVDEFLRWRMGAGSSAPQLSGWEPDEVE